MSVNERLARIEESNKNIEDKVTALVDLLNPLIKQTERNTESIAWIVRLGTVAVSVTGLFSAWAGFFRRH